LNAQLRLKLLRGDAQQRATPPVRAELKLLGEGLDAIIQHTKRPPWFLERLFYPGGINDPRLPNQPTERQRLSRYLTAVSIHPLHTDHSLASMREILGWQFREAWQCHRYPNFRRIRGLMPVPLQPKRKARA
jgi:hypothetical protein